MRVPFLLAVVALAAYGCSSSTDENGEDQAGDVAAGTLVKYEVPGLH